MKQQLGIALRLLLTLSVLTGLLYPLTVTGIAQILLPFQANGSLVVKDGKVIGSCLIGQNFSGPEYFHGRPSAAGAGGYDATASSGSNQGPTSRQLIKTTDERVRAFRNENGLAAGDLVPADLATASGSGLDPDISPAAARLQARRIASVRGIDLDTVNGFIDNGTKPKQFGLLGEPRVNVLELNLALDAVKRDN